MSTPSPRDETEGFPEYGDSMKVRRGLQLSSLSLFVSSLSHLFHICFLKSAVFGDQINDGQIDVGHINYDDKIDVDDDQIIDYDDQIDDDDDKIDDNDQKDDDDAQWS